MATNAGHDQHLSPGHASGGPGVLPPPDVNASPLTDNPAEAAPLPGDLTSAWHKTTLLLWVLVLLGLAAVWSSSAQLGLATWWLGPRGDRNPVVIQLLPFIPPLAMQIITLLGVRWTAVYGVVAGTIIAVIGIPDFSRVAGLAWIEVGIGLAAIVVSLASLTGTYRRVEPQTSR